MLASVASEGVRSGWARGSRPAARFVRGRWIGA